MQLTHLERWKMGEQYFRVANEPKYLKWNAGVNGANVENDESRGNDVTVGRAMGNYDLIKVELEWTQPD